MNKDEYYTNIAIAVRKKANCMGRKVGAIIVKENRIIFTGYNGTPEGITNCMDGGCVRCRDRNTYKASVGYDLTTGWGTPIVAQFIQDLPHFIGGGGGGD